MNKVSIKNNDNMKGDKRARQEDFIDHKPDVNEITNKIKKQITEPKLDGFNLLVDDLFKDTPVEELVYVFAIDKRDLRHLLKVANYYHSKHMIHTQLKFFRTYITKALLTYVGSKKKKNDLAYIEALLQNVEFMHHLKELVPAMTVQRFIRSIYSWSNITLEENQLHHLELSITDLMTKEIRDVDDNVELQGMMDIGLKPETQQILNQFLDILKGTLPSNDEKDRLFEILNTLSDNTTAFANPIEHMKKGFTSNLEELGFSSDLRTNITSTFTSTPVFLTVALVLAFAIYRRTQCPVENRAIWNIAILGCSAYLYFSFPLEQRERWWISWSTMCANMYNGTSEETVEVQGGESMLITLISGVVSMFSSVKLSSFELYRCQSLFSLSKSIPEFLTGVVDVVKMLINMISVATVGHEIFSSTIEEFQTIEAKFQALVKTVNTQKLIISVETLHTIQLLAEEFKDISIRTPKRKANFNLSNICAQRLRYLEGLVKYVDGFILDVKGVRQEPVSVMIHGEPGTFKSCVLNELVYEAFKISLSEEEYPIAVANRSNYVFNRQGQEFWDGFLPTTDICLMDDFGQARDSISAPNLDYEALIRMYNTSPYPLNMSRAEDKGRFFFKARWIIGTTNQGRDFQVESLFSAEAVKRRLDVQVTPILLETIEKPDTVLDIALEQFKFKVVTTNHRLGITEGSMLNSAEFVAVLAKAYKLKQSYYSNSIRKISQRLKSHDQVEEQSLSQQEDEVSMSELPDLSCTDVFKEFHITIPDECPHYRVGIPVNQWYREAYVPWAEGMGLDPKKILDTYNALCTEKTLNTLVKYFNHDEIMVGAMVLKTLLIYRDSYDNSAEMTNYGWDFTTYWMFRIINKQGYMHDFLEKRVPRPTLAVHLGKYMAFSRFVDAQFSGDGLLEDLIVGTVLGTIGLSAAIATVKLSTFVFNSLWNFIRPEGDDDNQGNYIKGIGSKKNTAAKKEVKTGRLQKLSELQAGDTNGKEIMDRVLINVFNIAVSHNGNITPMGLLTFLDTNTCFMPLHFYTQVVDNIEPPELFKVKYLISQNGRHELEISFADLFDTAVVYDQGGVHLILMRIQQEMKPKKDIRGYFALDADMNAYLTGEVNIMVALPSDNMRTSISIARIDKVSTSVLKITRGINYYADSAKGDCGSLLLSRDGRMQKRRILGMHLAGQPKGCAQLNCYANFITQEILKVAEDFFDDSELQSGIARFDMVIGKSSHYHDPYNTTSYRKSPLFKDANFPRPHKYPAKCMPSEDKDPLKLVLAKYWKRETEVRDEQWLLAIDDYGSTLCAQPSAVVDEMVPFHTALWGDPLLPYRRAISAKTSPGFPLKYEDKKYKKRFLPYTEFDSVLDGDELMDLEQECSDIISDANVGKRRKWYYLISLKDELLPKEKVKAGKARPFCCTPFKLLLVSKMLFGQFVEWYYTNCLDRGHGATLNPYEDWGILCRKLEAFSDDFETCVADSSDFSGFDSSNSPLVMNACLEIINQWYTAMGLTEYKEARKTIFLDVINSFHILQDEIHEWTSSLPSGTYLTLVINCMSNNLIFRYAYYRSLDDASVPIKTFNKLVSFVAVGDDNVYSCSSEIRDIFNPRAIAGYASELGFVMTSDSKGELTEWRMLKDITFLKRGFRKEGHKYFAPLAIDTMMSTIMWSRKGSLYQTIFSQNLHWFFRELCQHDARTFEYHAGLVRGSLKHLNLTHVVDDLYRNQSFWRTIVSHSDVFNEHE
jgi:hypothetical protein